MTYALDAPSAAVLSPCERFRYLLTRNWDSSAPKYGFFGVNPSTADATINDPTVRKWIGFVSHWGGGGFYVGNVFAYRSTKVKLLAEVPDPVGLYNDRAIDDVIQRCDVLVPCWGDESKVPPALRHHFGTLMLRLARSGKPVKVFGFTKNGSPKHPLMLSYSTELASYRPQLIRKRYL